MPQEIVALSGAHTIGRAFKEHPRAHFLHGGANNDDIYLFQRQHQNI